MSNGNKSNKIKYITGKYALNIHRKEFKTTGDWHDGVWDGITEYPSVDITMAGEGSGYDTVFIWGEYGIYEGKEMLEGMGIKCLEDKVMIANHERAILDMLYMYLAEFGEIWEIEDAGVNFLANKKSIKEMLEKSKLICPHIGEKENREYNEWNKNEMKALKWVYRWNSAEKV